MMKRKCKKRIATIVMCLCLLMGLMPTKVYAAENSVSLPVSSIESEAEKDGYVDREGVTVTFTSDTPITLGTLQGEHRMKFDYYWPMQYLESYGIEEGYDKLVECSISFPLVDFQGSELTGQITIPLPSGCDGATAKIVGGAAATSSTETTVTFPVTLNVSEYDSIARGGFVVEYKQQQQHQHSSAGTVAGNSISSSSGAPAVVDGIPATVITAAAAENKTVAEYINNAVVEVPGIPDAVPAGQGGNVIINGAPSKVTFFLTKPSAATVKAAKEQATTLGGKVLNVFGTSAVISKFENATVNFYMKGVKAGQQIKVYQLVNGQWVEVEVAEIREDHVVINMKSHGTLAFVEVPATPAQ